jgi:hypothetical protein
MVPEGPPEGSVRTPKQVQRRLDPGELDALVERYRAGVEVRALAAQSGVHRSTMIAPAVRHGVPGRKGKLDGKLDEARVLYEQGWSLMRVGEHFGVGPAAVWNAFRSAGVQRRPRRVLG